MDNSAIMDFFESAVKNNVSDIHLTLGQKPVFRINGKLVVTHEFAVIDNEKFNQLLEIILPEKFKDGRNLHKECDFSFSLDCNETMKGYRFRGNLSYECGKPMLVLRLIAPFIKSVEELNLPEKLNEISRSRNGLFIITGPTGSGKSTTLAALISSINSEREVHIITIEDPIEYVFESDKALIHQKEIGTDTESFSGALRLAMRQDPDVIMIGELRDFETISAAITAAETGHLVLCTLHTPDAPQSIDRIIDVFPPYQQQQIRTQLASVLIGIISQQLIPSADGMRRVAATELLLVNNAVRNYIRENKTAQLYHVLQTGAISGMHLMDQDIARLYKRSVITMGDALKYCQNKKDIETYIRNE